MCMGTTGAFGRFGKMKCPFLNSWSWPSADRLLRKHQHTVAIQQRLGQLLDGAEKKLEDYPFYKHRTPSSFGAQQGTFSNALLAQRTRWAWDFPQRQR